MQYACVGLKAARDDGRDHTGVERREAVADPGRFLNLDTLLHTRLSHESIIQARALLFAKPTVPRLTSLLFVERSASATWSGPAGDPEDRPKRPLVDRLLTETSLRSARSRSPDGRVLARRWLEGRLLDASRSGCVVEYRLA
jgi:hypothetical protein